MHLKLGDTLNFNVQGAPIQTMVGGTREVDWNRVQTNFLVVFPTGVLEQAPQFHVLMTRVPNNQVSAVLQRGLVSRFPNVSAIDLGLILKTVDEILAQISFVIQFMALFSILPVCWCWPVRWLSANISACAKASCCERWAPAGSRFYALLRWNTAC